MKAYSQDLRERVLRAVDLGRPRAEVVQLFGVSLATIKRYLKQRREEGHMRPKAIPGRPPKKRAQVEADVLPQLQAHDDATLERHSAMWEQTHGERVSRWRPHDLAVPLMQLEGIHVDEETQQAIEDWRYWVNQGYEL